MSARSAPPSEVTRLRELAQGADPIASRLARAALGERPAGPPKPFVRQPDRWEVRTKVHSAEERERSGEQGRKWARQILERKKAAPPDGPAATKETAERDEAEPFKGA